MEYKVKDINDLELINASEVSAVIGTDKDGQIIRGFTEVDLFPITVEVSEDGDGVEVVSAAELGYEGISEVSVSAVAYGMRRNSDGYNDGYNQGETDGYDRGFFEGYERGKEEGGQVL